MNVVAENKRRVLAAAAAVIVLLAIGFAIGRISSGPAQAQAAGPAPTRATTARMRSAPESATTSLRAELLQAQRAGDRAAEQLVAARVANRRLSATSRQAKARLRKVRNCQSIQRRAAFRRCVSMAAG